MKQKIIEKILKSDKNYWRMVKIWNPFADLQNFPKCERTLYQIKLVTKIFIKNVRRLNHFILF